MTDAASGGALVDKSTTQANFDYGPKYSTI